MKTIAELAQTGGSGWSAVDDVTLGEPPQEWAPEIIKRAAPLCKAESVLGAAGRVYTIAGNYFRIPIGTAMTEPSDWSAMTPGSADFESEDFDINDLALSLSRYGFRSEISRDAINDWAPVGLNVMDALKQEMITWLAIKKDQLILQDDANSDLSASALSSVVSGSDSTIDSGDTLAPEDLNEAKTLIEENNRADDGEFFFFAHPRQVKALRDDSQFTNAAEYGSNRVVMTGEIGEYLGIRIIVTTNVASYTSSGTDFNTDGYEGLLINSRYAYAVATNDPLLIEPDYDASQTLHEINASFTYAVGNIDTNAAVLVASSKS